MYYAHSFCLTSQWHECLMKTSRGNTSWKTEWFTGSLIRPIVPPLCTEVKRKKEREKKKQEAAKTDREKESRSLSSQTAHCKPNRVRLSDNSVLTDFVYNQKFRQIKPAEFWKKINDSSTAKGWSWFSFYCFVFHFSCNINLINICTLLFFMSIRRVFMVMEICSVKHGRPSQSMTSSTWRPMTRKE